MISKEVLRGIVSLPGRRGEESSAVQHCSIDSYNTHSTTS